MMINKVTPPLQLVVETFGRSVKEPTNQNSIKVPKVVKSGQRHYKTLGNQYIKQPNVLSLPQF